MKVEAMPFPAVNPFPTTAQPSGDGAVFEHLLSLPSPQADASISPAAKEKQTFSFDALGILGVGGGTVFGRMPADGLSNRDTLDLPVTAPPVTTPPVTAPSFVVAPSVAGQWPVMMTPQVPVEGNLVMATVPATSRSSGPSALAIAGVSIPGAAAGVPLSQMGSMRPAAVVPVSLDPALTGGEPLSGTASLSTSEGPQPEERAAARESLKKFTIDRQSASSSDDINVAVSETDGVVHVIAAASDVTDKTRAKIRGVAEGLANDAGLKLGSFVLNGATTLYSHKFFSRSLSWPEQ